MCVVLLEEGYLDSEITEVILNAKVITTTPDRVRTILTDKHTQSFHDVDSDMNLRCLKLQRKLIDETGVLNSKHDQLLL